MSPKNFISQWTLARKIALLATFLSLFLSGVTFNLFSELQKIYRELEEVVTSDYPLDQKTRNLEIYQQKQQNIIEQIFRLSRLKNQEVQPEIEQKIKILQQTNQLLQTELKQAQEQAVKAAQEEQIKEGSFRLNKNQEDYQLLEKLFKQLEQENQTFINSVNQAIAILNQGKIEEASVIIAESIKVKKSIEDLTKEIYTRLDQHIDGSLKATHREIYFALILSIILNLIILAIGIASAKAIASQLQTSITKVVEQANQIADNINHEMFQNDLLKIDEENEMEAMYQALNQILDSLVSSNLERKKIEQIWYKEKELAQVTLQSIGDAVITTDATGKIVYLNPIAETLTGWSKQEAQNYQLEQVFQIKDEITKKFLTDLIPKKLVAKNNQKNIFEKIPNFACLVSKSQQEFIIKISAAPIKSQNQQIIGTVIVFHDITKEREIAQKLSWQATHDELTGLINRREFEHRLKQICQNKYYSAHDYTLLYLDLDRFKIINDSCGHFAGDELLKQIAILLQAQVPIKDTVARLGGDEFAVILSPYPIEKVLEIANNLLTSIQKFRFVWQDKVFHLGISIGVVSCSPQYDNSIGVLKAADAACYAAKTKGRNQIYLVHNKEIELAQQSQEMRWLSLIQQALEHNKFRLYYQTIVPLQDFNDAGEHYEVLLRLQDDNGTILSPMSFIPIAERYDLMKKIDRWTISNLFATQGAYYRQQQKGKIRNLYTINLSGQSLDDDSLSDFIEEQFYLHRIPPKIICFEITETAAIANLDKARHLITRLKQVGCTFALDDFGSGMSSFAYLKNLPVDYLKIDGIFIKDLLDNPINCTIVEAINQVSHTMKIKTIAEFVDNYATMAKLKLLGVDYAQGYGIAEPQPLLTYFDVVKK
ncbi:diguanylate cyclase/phosphodiesterase with PAS/PAC sensor(s) [Stanieria cyanosphaera PCC 7437]|uniref:Diguanylate cyclase/phosphodiesterase with PAS/PAC sensor(S) n=1 Tax=Stanieria cyanosphaera (strain ATCC 29371 / PCC 7437) TaxID=111780 RepID=K9XQD1_STAC7|nr:EAL domain-containing protein [Stanieria cyanosphaera]AFZ34830.1 diguanylate cyclase/phosphodiesterase with PAS/PAC sensor(s) [Stanieria cyanosphaera PCC 7437]